MVELPDPILFKEHTADELHQRLAGAGVSARLARRLQDAVLQRRVSAIPAEMPEVARHLLERVRQVTTIPRLALIDRTVSPRGG